MRSIQTYQTVLEVNIECTKISPLAFTAVTGQNGNGQNGTDKMVRTKWYGQNGRKFWNSLQLK